MNQGSRTNGRIDQRMAIKIDCILANRSGSIKAQTIDVSVMGLGIVTDSTLPFKMGDELTARVPILSNYSSMAKVIWTKKNFNNITRLGLKLFSDLDLN